MDIGTRVSEAKKTIPLINESDKEYARRLKEALLSKLKSLVYWNTDNNHDDDDKLQKALNCLKIALTGNVSEKDLPLDDLLHDTELQDKFATLKDKGAVVAFNNDNGNNGTYKTLRDWYNSHGRDPVESHEQDPVEKCRDVIEKVYAVTQRVKDLPDDNGICRFLKNSQKIFGENGKDYTAWKTASGYSPKDKDKRDFTPLFITPTDVECSRRIYDWLCGADAKASLGRKETPGNYEEALQLVREQVKKRMTPTRKECRNFITDDNDNEIPERKALLQTLEKLGE